MDRLTELCGRPPVVADWNGWGQEGSLAEADISGTEALFLGWGSPPLAPWLVERMPRLRIVLYTAGSCKHLATPEFVAAAIPLCSAADANAVPVAEYAFAQVILALKRHWQLAAQTRAERTFPRSWAVPGAFGTMVGVVSLGLIGRRLVERLKTTDLKVLAWDPFVPAEEIAAMGVEPAGLERLFRESDVATLHTPMLEATRGMVGRELLLSMKQGAALINTARGGLIDEPGLIEAARERPDLQFLLDVTDPEPPAPDSPLYDLPNVVLTPHIAGAFGSEQKRLGLAMVDELARFTLGQPLRRQVDLARLDLIA